MGRHLRTFVGARHRIIHHLTIDEEGVFGCTAVTIFARGTLAQLPNGPFVRALLGTLGPLAVSIDGTSRIDDRFTK